MFNLRVQIFNIGIPKVEPLDAKPGVFQGFPFNSNKTVHPASFQGCETTWKTSRGKARQELYFFAGLSCNASAAPVCKGGYFCDLEALDFGVRLER